MTDDQKALMIEEAERIRTLYDEWDGVSIPYTLADRAADISDLILQVLNSK